MNEIDLITNFLNTLDIRVIRANHDRESFISGVYIDGMSLHVFLDKLESPGDILHEAGHIAIVPALFRDRLFGDVEKSLGPHIEVYMKTHDFHLNDDTMTENPVMRGLIQCGEGEAQAWSYAAALEAGIPPESVFHPNAYEGESESILTMMSIGRHFGVHGLQAAKMTTVRTFPKMIRWLQV